MSKNDEKSQNNNYKPKKMFIGVVWNCAPDLKLVLSTLLFVCSIIFVTLFQLDLRDCTSFRPQSSELLASSPPPVQGKKLERSFNGYGTAAYNFVLMSAYRGGGDTFAVVGLSSKPLHLFAKPTYLCQWVPHSNAAAEDNGNLTTAGYKILPDWGYGRVYTVVVVNCTFPFPVGEDGAGGRLLVHASTGDASLNLTDTIEALVEAPGRSFNASLFESPPRFEYLYCGSPLYGDLSPQRVREWIAYHVNLFGERSHFVIYDAGGVHPEVMAVLRPWIETGYLTLHDIREEERFDGYYHNQFLVVNDCLHRHRFMAKWMFFFDVDEFIYVPKETTIKNVTDSLLGYTQFTIEQRFMSNKLCYLDDDPGRKWGIEKMVYRDTKRGIRRDRKYAVQPRSVFATGVHMSQNLKGRSTHKTDGKIMYYHYHGTISERQEPCRHMVNTAEKNIDGTPYVVDTTMREAAGAVKRFELRTIGPVLQNTHQ